MMAEDKGAFSREFVEQVWNRGNLSFLDENCVEDFRPNMVPPSLPKTLDGFKQYVSMFRTAIPDMHVHTEDVIVGGDKSVIRWTVRGTHDGPLMGLEPTGKSVEFTGMSILRFDGGRIAEMWAEADQYGFMVQIGQVEPPGRPPSSA